MEINWDLKKCIEMAEIVCDHYHRSWGGYATEYRAHENNKSALNFHLSFDPKKVIAMLFLMAPSKRW